MTIPKQTISKICFSEISTMSSSSSYSRRTRERERACMSERANVSARANLVPRVRDPFGLRQGSRRVVSADQSDRGLWERDCVRKRARDRASERASHRMVS